MALTWSLNDTGAHIASPSYCYDFTRFLNRIYASCLYGIPYTTDTGANWTMTNLRPNGTNYYCNRLIVHNGRLFASGDYRVSPVSSICYYTDDGINWTTKRISNTYLFPKGYDFYSNGNRLFLMHSANRPYGAEGKYYYTDDNGVTWSGVAHTLRVSSSMAEHDDKFYVGGNYNNSNFRNKVIYSTDPITPSWINAVDGLSVVNSTFIRSLKEFDDNLYCCDSRGSVYKLIDPTTWTEVFSGLTSCRHLDVFYGKLYVCGDSATIEESSVYSTVDGETWIAEGITSYSTDVYGIWGDSVDFRIWAGTVNSRAWVSENIEENIEEIGSYSAIEIDKLLSVKESNQLYSLQEMASLHNSSDLVSPYSVENTGLLSVKEIAQLHSATRLEEG